MTPPDRTPADTSKAPLLVRLVEHYRGSGWDPKIGATLARSVSRAVVLHRHDDLSAFVEHLAACATPPSSKYAEGLLHGLKEVAVIAAGRLGSDAEAVRLAIRLVGMACIGRFLSLEEAQEFDAETVGLALADLTQLESMGLVRVEAIGDALRVCRSPLGHAVAEVLGGSSEVTL